MDVESGPDGEERIQGYVIENGKMAKARFRKPRVVVSSPLSQQPMMPSQLPPIPPDDMTADYNERDTGIAFKDPRSWFAAGQPYINGIYNKTWTIKPPKPEKVKSKVTLY